MSNRVDDLENEIAELRAAVNGLTEELVETKARVRELEDAEEADRNAAAATAAADETTVKSDDRVEVVEQPDTEPPETESESETDTPSEPTDEANNTETEQGDIIVA